MDGGWHDLCITPTQVCALGGGGERSNISTAMCGAGGGGLLWGREPYMECPHGNVTVPLVPYTSRRLLGVARLTPTQVSMRGGGGATPGMC